MSGQVKLSLPSGGSVTVAAADSANNYTVTLPVGTGNIPITALASTSATLAAGATYAITSPTAITLTLPASPSAGDTISLVDYNTITASVKHTLARNGSTIYGLAQDLTLDIPNFQATLWYSGSTWNLI